MVNLIGLMPDWSWEQFDNIMRKAATNCVELIPGMLLGPDWDKQIGPLSEYSDMLERFRNTYNVTSVQSLTYGLSINLSEDLSANNDALRRFQSLALLGDLLDCKIFVLGSPGQKKLKALDISPDGYKYLLIENCAWMASILCGPNILSLEHNTSAQGAEFCNTLGSIVDVVLAVRKLGHSNVGLNLDTKCLLQEFGDSLNLVHLIDEYELHSILTSIQVSFDFLRRSGCQARSDESALLELARSQHCTISLEEYGLLDEELNGFIGAWQSALSHSTTSE